MSRVYRYISTVFISLAFFITAYAGVPHKQMIDAIVKELSEDEIPMVTKVLDELDHFFLTFKAKEETQ